MLADVFEKIRKIRLKGCGLSLSDSTLSWDAMLNMKKVELDFVSDSYMYLFFEKAIRGRVSYISKRYSKANNKHLKSDDLTQEWKHIYIHKDTSYGYTMSKFLPEAGFKWIDPEKFDSNKHSSSGLNGCVLEFDLDIRKNYVNYIIIIL